MRRRSADLQSRKNSLVCTSHSRNDAFNCLSFLSLSGWEIIKRLSPSSVLGDMRQVSSSSSSEDNITRSSDRRPGDGALEEAAAGASDGDKRDILDLLKLSYIVVRTGIGTGQIMVRRYVRVAC